MFNFSLFTKMQSAQASSDSSNNSRTMRKWRIVSRVCTCILVADLFFMSKLVSAMDYSDGLVRPDKDVIEEMSSYYVNESTASDSILTRLSYDLLAVNPHVLERLEEDEGEIVIGDRPICYRDDPEPSKSNITGVFFPGENLIYLNSKNYWSHTVIHELGHYIDYNAESGDDENLLSSREEFREMAGTRAVYTFVQLRYNLHGMSFSESLESDFYYQESFAVLYQEYVTGKSARFLERNGALGFFDGIMAEFYTE